MGNADKRVVARAEHFYTTQDLLVKTVSHCDVFLACIGCSQLILLFPSLNCYSFALCEVT